MCYYPSMKVITDEKKIDEVLNIGVEEIIEKEHLTNEMKLGRCLNVKFGIDPTMPDLKCGSKFLSGAWRRGGSAGFFSCASSQY